MNICLNGLISTGSRQADRMDQLHWFGILIYADLYFFFFGKIQIKCFQLAFSNLIFFSFPSNISFYSIVVQLQYNYTTISYTTYSVWGQLSATCSNLLKQPKGELRAAVDHNQLRTMAPETVDPIDWSYPPPSWAVSLERFLHSINQGSLRESTLQLQNAEQPCILPKPPLRLQ